MIHVFFGNSPIGVRKLAYECADRYEVKGIKLARIDADVYLPGSIANASLSSSLFGEQLLYLIDTPSSESGFNEEVVGSLEALKESPHIFIIVEETLLAAEKKKFEKYAFSLEEVKEDKVSSFNAFALADSLARKDKKMLWLGLCEAKANKLSAEEIIGTLWWQLKTLLLVSKTDHPEEAGIKDFPYNKAKRALSLFKEKEIANLADSLLAVYHQGHQGEVDIDIALEKWTLSI